MENHRRILVHTILWDWRLCWRVRSRDVLHVGYRLFLGSGIEDRRYGVCQNLPKVDERRL